MADFPAMPLFTDAYLADTRHLSTLEHGAYLLLLMEAWRRPTCSLPNNDRILARLSGLSEGEWSEIRDVVMDFWVLDGRSGTFKQKRLSNEREFVTEKSRSQRDKAKSRWNKTKKDDATAIPNDMPDECRGDAGDMPDGMPDECPDDAPTPTPTPTDSVLANARTHDVQKSEKSDLDHLWERGPRVLADLGVPEGQVKGLIGRWLKTARPGVVIAAIRAARDIRADDPVPFIFQAISYDDPEIHARFQKFWAAYPEGPNKSDQPRALRVFADAVRGRIAGVDRATPDEITAGAAAYRATEPEPRFVPKPHRWLTDAKWIDATRATTHPFPDHPKLSRFDPQSPTFVQNLDAYFSIHPDEASDLGWPEKRKAYG